MSLSSIIPLNISLLEPFINDVNITNENITNENKEINDFNINYAQLEKLYSVAKHNK